jgi:hypothetical protein
VKDGYASDDEDKRLLVLAIASDVEKIELAMGELEKFEDELSAEESPVTHKAMELKQNIKKLMTSPELSESLNNLEVGGDLVWGLSQSERQLIMAAREKANSV